MPSAGGTFVWNAALAAAVPGLDLVFRVPAATYAVIGDSNGQIGRTPGATDAATFDLFQAVSAKAWSLPLGPPALLGTGGDPALFLGYLGQKLGVFQAGGGDATDLASEIDVDFLSFDGELLDRARLDAIFFMKNLYDTAEQEPMDFGTELLSRHSAAGLTALIARDGFLVARAAYDALVDALTAKILAEVAAAPLTLDNGAPNAAVAAGNAVASLGRIAYHTPLYVIAYLADLSGPTPMLVAAPPPADTAAITHLLGDLGTTDFDGTLKLIRDAFAGLFDFALATDGIKLQPVAGTIEIKTDGVVATAADLALYDLALDYTSTDADGEESAARLHVDWSLATPAAAANTWSFDFASVQAVFPARSDETLTLTVRSADGLILWTKDYRAGNPALAALRLSVALIGPGAISPADRATTGSKRLRGQIVDMTRTATLKDAMVVIQVKAKDDTDWRIVGSSASDAGGNFSMAYLPAVKGAHPLTRGVRRGRPAEHRLRRARLISEWDTIFYRDIAPALFERIVDHLFFSITPPGKSPTPASPTADNSYKGIAADFSTTSRYTGGTARMTLSLRASSSIARKDVPTLLYLQAGGAVATLGDVITFRLEDMTLHYTTAHFTNVLFSGHLGDDLQDGTLVYMPLTSEDKRNPMHEDAVLERTLIDHLNSNLEHYNKSLWLNLDPDRRYLLLDGFNIQVYNDFGAPLGLKSLASVVKNELAGIAGNAMVIPVAAGVKVSPTYVMAATDTGAPAAVTLLDHYKPAEDMAPYRLSVPTRGVYAEAMMGKCNSCEKVEEDTSQDWTKFTTDTPTAINAITPATAVTTDWKATFQNLAAATVGIQKAPDAPAVGAGDAGMTTALTGPSGFKDVTGLVANQSNAMDTYKANNATVEKMATAAAGLASQEHNTTNADKIQEGLDKAKDSGALSKDDHADLTKQHNQQKIDGGAAAKRKEDADAKAAKAATGKPSLTDAAVDAIGKNKHVVASKTKKKGGTDTIEVKPTDDTTTDDGTDDGTATGQQWWNNTVVFKALDCWGDVMQAEWHVTVNDTDRSVEAGYDEFEQGTGTLKANFKTATPTFQIKVVAPEQDDAVSPILKQVLIFSDAITLPADKSTITVTVQQRGSKRTLTTTDTKLSVDRILTEYSGEIGATVGGKGSSGSTTGASTGTSANGATSSATSGGSAGLELNAQVAAKIAARYQHETTNTTGQNNTVSYDMVLPTAFYDLTVK